MVAPFAGLPSRASFVAGFPKSAFTLGDEGKAMRIIIFPMLACALCFTACRSAQQRDDSPGPNGATKNFMLSGFAVSVRSDRFWPVMANIGVEPSMLEEVKHRSGEIKTVIATRLAGLHKEDIFSNREKQLFIEREILNEVNRRVPGKPVRHVLLESEVK